MTPLALTGARVFDGTAIREGLAVIIDGRRIAGVMAERDVGAGLARHGLGGGVLSPGFIDVQVNGGGGALLNAEPSVATVRQIAQSHRRFGTTGLLPTVITDAPDVLARAIAVTSEAQRVGVPGILGIHIEGPFLDVARKGAHDQRFIRELTMADIAQVAAITPGAVMLTVAPNRVKPELIVALAVKGVRVSLGHAEATCAEAQAALAVGASAFTHIFNAMSQMTGREPGMVGAALADNRSFIGLIADGLHVEDSAMKVALAAAGPDRIMLVSDAMPPAAGGPDRFLLQGREVVRVAGRLQLADGTLAGSNLTMDEAVRYCVRQLGVSLADALKMATLTPARFLGRDHDLGRISEGYLASLVHLGDDLTVRRTWIEGT
jgi:N-acetylglucosamine-6-phosphate deacetylase